MPTAHSATTTTDFDIDTSTHTITLKRMFDAPAADIFEAWTQPEHVSCWWDAAGEPLVICEIDPRVGGAFKFASKGHMDMPFSGIYRELSPPHRIVFEAMGATGRVLLEEASSKTHMTVEIECRSAEQLKQYLKMGIAAGASKTLDNLVAYARRFGA